MAGSSGKRFLDYTTITAFFQGGLQNFVSQRRKCVSLKKTVDISEQMVYHRKNTEGGGKMEYLGQLNPEQREAATTTEGYIRVVAGAGSGKLHIWFSKLASLYSIVSIFFIYTLFFRKSFSKIKIFLFFFMITGGDHS